MRGVILNRNLRVVGIWKELQEGVVEPVTITTFKRHVDRFGKIGPNAGNKD